MSLEQKIKALLEKKEMLEAAKAKDTDFSDDMDKGYDNDGDAEGDASEGEAESPDIEDSDETKEAKKKDVAMKESTKIDLGALFDGADLTEEFKTKATTIFEAAVEARVKQVTEQLEEELAQRAINESEELTEGLVDKVDGYLDFVVEQWIKDNEIALDRGIKAEIFESFVSKMHDVFVEHNINLPDEEFDLVESLQDEVDAVKNALDEQVAANVELNATLKGIAKQVKIDEASEGMTDYDKERFAFLAEEISFDDEESFAKKLDVIRENYVSKPAKEVKQLTEDKLEDSNTPPQITESVEKKIDPTMARYLDMLGKK